MKGGGIIFHKDVENKLINAQKAMLKDLNDEAVVAIPCYPLVLSLEGTPLFLLDIATIKQSIKAISINTLKASRLGAGFSVAVETDFEKFELFLPCVEFLTDVAEVKKKSVQMNIQCKVFKIALIENIPPVLTIEDEVWVKIV